MKAALKGLYVITDNKLIPEDQFIENVEKALKGGADIVQLREKNTPHREIISRGKELLKLTRKYRVPLIINDLPELAVKIGADGVHLGESDQSVRDARGVVGEESIIGVSCYGNLERGFHAEREGADYVAFGTPFFTPTKPERAPTSFDILREVVKKIRLPIFAIGGITAENAQSVLETGVDGIAVITSVFGSSNPENAAGELRSIIKSHFKKRT